MGMERPWLKNYPEDIPKTIEYPEVPLSRFLEDSAERYGNRTAIIYFGHKISYKELNEFADSFAMALQSLGVAKGDRVAIQLPNIPQYIIAFYAALKIGAIVVQTNPMYTEWELERMLNDSGARTIITLRHLYPKVRALKEKTGLQEIIVARIRDFLPSVKKMLYPLKQLLEGDQVKVGKDAYTYEFKDLLKRHLGEKPEATQIKPAEDIALLQYTGGTTGIPKGAMLTHKNLLANTIQTRSWFTKAVEGEEICLSVLPFFHVYGMTVCMNLPIYMAATMILLPRFEIDEILETINHYHPTLFPGVPTMYVAINNHPQVKRYDIRSIRECISGSAPLPLEVKRRFEELTGGKLVEGYGLSEASPVTHCNPLYGLQKEGSIGIPFPDTDSKIVDLETGKDLGINEVGELAVSGPQVMKGYWRNPEETAKVLKDNWLYTGDIAKMDEQGYFYIVDRKKDMIISGGLKIYPREVEEILYQHPKVREAAVVGIPDEYWGESVKAFIVPKAGKKPSAEEIIAFCAEKLSKFKVPKVVEFKEELPKTMVGKVLRRELKK